MTNISSRLRIVKMNDADVMIILHFILKLTEAELYEVVFQVLLVWLLAHCRRATQVSPTHHDVPLQQLSWLQHKVQLVRLSRSHVAAIRKHSWWIHRIAFWKSIMCCFVFFCELKWALTKLQRCKRPADSGRLSETGNSLKRGRAAKQVSAKQLLVQRWGFSLISVELTTVFHLQAKLSKRPLCNVNTCQT